MIGNTSSYLQNEPQNLPPFSRSTINNEVRISSQPITATGNMNYEASKPTDFLASIIRQTLGDKERSKSPFGGDYNTSMNGNLGADGYNYLAPSTQNTLYETEISKMPSYTGNYSSLNANYEPWKNYAPSESRNTLTKADALKNQDYNIPVSKSAIYEPETLKPTYIENSSIYPKTEVKDLYTRSSTWNTQTQKEQEEPPKQYYVNPKTYKTAQSLNTKTFLEHKSNFFLEAFKIIIN